MPLLADYKALTPQSTSNQVQSVLNAIIKANVALISSGERLGLVEQILDDLKEKEKGRLHSAKDRPLALEVLKTLGRFPDSAKLISTKASLELLMKTSDVSLDVTRTIANALLLQSEGRQNFIDVDGGSFALKMLSSNSDATSLFLASRLLFLMTHDSSSVPFMRELIENDNIVEVTTSKMDTLVKQLGTDSMAKEALSDMMKYIYNITLHFSRAEMGNTSLVMGEAWSDKLGCWVAPLISCFHNVPFSTLPSRPLQPPMTHIVHCLLSIPTEGYKEAWYSTPTSSPIGVCSSSFFKNARSFFTSKSGSTTPPLLKRTDSKSKKPKSRNPSPSPSPSRSSSSSSSPGRSSTDVGHVDTLQRSFNLVSACLEHYFPGEVEVDAKEVRDRATSEGVILDELISGPLLLLRKLADGDGDARKKAKNMILPEDLDRTDPLEGRPDTLGRLIRLLASVYHPRLANCAGELIFTICDSNSSMMSAQIGYGNAAGYLFNKGILSAPPPPPSSSNKGKEPRRSTSTESSDEDTPEGSAINPITGTTYRPREHSAVDEMTEEEKEREAEKLFVLFDRLEKSGVTANPIREALHRGDLEKYKE